MTNPDNDDTYCEELEVGNLGEWANSQKFDFQTNNAELGTQDTPILSSESEGNAFCCFHVENNNSFFIHVKLFI